MLLHKNEIEVLKLDHEILYTCYRHSTDLTLNCKIANTKRKEIVIRFTVLESKNNPVAHGKHCNN